MAHVSWEELERRQQEVSEKVPINSTWEHFRTKDHYRVIGHCIIEATDEAGILYRSLAHPIVQFPRPYSDWIAHVELDGALVPRFQQIN